MSELIIVKDVYGIPTTVQYLDFIEAFVSQKVRLFGVGYEEILALTEMYLIAGGDSTITVESIRRCINEVGD